MVGECTLEDMAAAIKTQKQDGNIAIYRDFATWLVHELVMHLKEEKCPKANLLKYIKSLCETKSWHIGELYKVLQTLWKLQINLVQELQSTLEKWQEELEGESLESSPSMVFACDLVLKEQCVVVIGYAKKEKTTDEKILCQTTVIVNPASNIITNYKDCQSYVLFRLILSFYSILKYLYFLGLE